MASQSSQPILTKAPRPESWANHVAKHYVAGDTLELLKFSFEGDEGVSQIAIEKAVDFPELLQVVQEQLYCGNMDKALSRMIYTLDEVAGHRRYGKRSVCDLKNYGIQPPKAYDPSKEPKIVQLYQCLAKIASRLKPSHGDRLRNMYAKKLEINPDCRSTESVLSLLTHLVHRQLLTVDDQKDFVEALYNVGADKQLIHLKEYRERNELPMNDEYPRLEEAGSVEVSKTVTVKFWDKGPEGDTVSHDKRQRLQQVAGSIQDTSTGSTGLLVATEQEQLVNTEESPTGPSSGSDGSTRKKGIYTVWIVVGIISLLLCVAFDIPASIYGVHHASTHQYQGSSHLVYEGSVIRLCEFSPYYITEVQLSEDLQHDENAHTIHFYLINCDTLDTNKNTTVSEVTNSSLENITALYLMPNSEISYNICALTEAEPKHGVRLEVFILDNLEDARNFDPSRSEVYKSYPVCSKTCRCNTFTYAVVQPGYYSVRFVLRESGSYPVQYNYTMTLKQVSIASPPSNALWNCSTASINDYCTFQTGIYLPHDMHKLQCVIADIEVDEAEKSNYLHVIVGFVNNWGGLIASCVFLVLGIVIVLVTLLCFVAYKVTHGASESSRYTKLIN